MAVAYSPWSNRTRERRVKEIIRTLLSTVRRASTCVRLESYCPRSSMAFEFRLPCTLWWFAIPCDVRNNLTLDVYHAGLSLRRSAAIWRLGRTEVAEACQSAPCFSGMVAQRPLGRCLGVPLSAQRRNREFTSVPSSKHRFWENSAKAYCSPLVMLGKSAQCHR